MREVLLEVRPDVPSAVPAKKYTACSIECPRCSAGIGESCGGPTICPERLAIALDLVRSGELPEAPERDDSDVQACSDCRVTTNAKEQFLACGNPMHRCHRMLRTTGKQCRRVVVAGTRYCDGHKPNARRWNDSLSS